MIDPELRLAAVQALPLVPAYWLPYGLLPLLFPLRKGAGWRAGYAAVIILLMTPKPALDLCWLMYERARWGSILQGDLMAVCMPLTLLVCCADDWRPGSSSFSRIPACTRCLSCRPSCCLPRSLGRCRRGGFC